MSLKQYNPHLLLISRKSLFTYVVLLLVHAAAVFCVCIMPMPSALFWLSITALLLSSMVFLRKPIALEGSLVLKQQSILIDKTSYSVIAVNYWFGCVVRITAVDAEDKQRTVILAKDGLSQEGWCALIRYVKLFKPDSSS